MEEHERTEHHDAIGEPGDDDYQPAEDVVVREKYYDITVIANVSSVSSENQTLIFQWYKGASLISGSEADQYITTEPAGEPYPETAVKSTYRAHTTGTYTVMIGNKLDSKKSARFVGTGIVTIPKPEDVIADNDGLVPKGYVGEVTLHANISNEISYRNLSYTWFKDDGEVVAENTDTYVPDDEGIYYFGVTNSRNNDTTDYTPGSYSNTCDIRMKPQRLTSMTFEFNEEFGLLTVNTTHKYTNHKIQYTWYYTPVVDINSGELDTQQTLTSEYHGTGTYDELKPAIDKPGMYQVVAAEVVFDDDSVLRRFPLITEYTYSNYIYLVVQNGKLVNGTIQPEENNNEEENNG